MCVCAVFSGVSRLGLGLEARLKSSFFKFRSRSRRSQVSTRSRALSLETLHEVFFFSEVLKDAAPCKTDLHSNCSKFNRFKAAIS